MVVPVAPRFAIDQLGADALAFGLAMGVFSLASLAVRPIVGWSADRFGRRPLLVGGSLLTVVALLLHLGATDLSIFVAARAMLGVGEAAFLVAGPGGRWRSRSRAPHRGGAEPAVAVDLPGGGGGPRHRGGPARCRWLRARLGRRGRAGGRGCRTGVVRPGDPPLDAAGRRCAARPAVPPAWRVPGCPAPVRHLRDGSVPDVRAPSRPCAGAGRRGGGPRRVRDRRDPPAPVRRNAARPRRPAAPDRGRPRRDDHRPAPDRHPAGPGGPAGRDRRVRRRRRPEPARGHGAGGRSRGGRGARLRRGDGERIPRPLVRSRTGDPRPDRRHRRLPVRLPRVGGGGRDRGAGPPGRARVRCALARAAR